MIIKSDDVKSLSKLPFSKMKNSYKLLALIVIISCASIPNPSEDPCYQKPDYYLSESISDTSQIVEDFDERAQVLDPYQSKVIYPYPAVSNGVMGKVVAEVTISKNDELQEVRIVEGLGHCLNQEVVRVLTNVSYKAATKDDKPVRSKITVPIDFRLVGN